jgi:hypothetical protein
VRRLLAKLLRRVLSWLGEESDLEYRGRILNVLRRQTGIGSAADVEHAIQNALPVGAAVKLEWSNGGKTLRVDWL